MLPDPASCYLSSFSWSPCAASNTTASSPSHIVTSAAGLPCVLDWAGECILTSDITVTLHGRHDVSKYRQLPIFQQAQKKILQLRIDSLFRGTVAGDFPHKGPVILNAFPCHNNILTRGPFYYHGLTVIPAWINNYVHSKVWDEITYPFPSTMPSVVELIRGAVDQEWEPAQI